MGYGSSPDLASPVGLVPGYWPAWGLLVVLLCVALLLCWLRARKQYHTVLSLTGLSQQVLQTGMDPVGLYAAVAGHLLRIAPGATLALQLAGDSAGRPALTIIQGGRALAGDQQEAVGLGAYEWLRANRQVLIVPDLRRSPVEPLRLGVPARSAMFAPLLVGERFLGAISLQSRFRHGFTRRLQTALAVSAEQIALGLDGARLYQREQQRSAQLMLIAEVSRKVAAILDLDVLFADTVRLVQETLGYYHVSIFSINREAGTVELQASSSPLIQERGIVLPLGSGLIGHAALGQVIVANDVRQDERFIAHAALDRTAAEVALPLQVEDRVLGVLDLQSDRPNSFGEDELSTLRILADQIAVAIEDSQIYRAQQEQAWVSTALLQVAEALAKESTVEEIAALVSRLVRLLTGVERSAVLAYSPDTDEFCVPMPLQAEAREAACMLRYPAGQIPLLQGLTPGRMAAADLDALGPLARLWETESLHGRKVLAYPLAPRGQLLGVLLAQEPDAKGLPPAQRMVLEGIAHQAALALDSAALLAAQREEAWVSWALLQVANVIAGASYDLEDTVTTVVRLVPMLVGVSWCAILVRDVDQDRYTGVASYGLDPELQELASRPVYLAAELPWLSDMQHAEQVSVVPPPMVCGLLGLCPSEGQDAETLVLALRAHQRDLGLLLVGPKSDAPAIAGRRMTLLQGIAGQASLAISATRLYEQSVRQERLEHEMRLAMNIQTSFLPECCPEVPGWQIAVDWRAARGVSGDYYDFLTLSPALLGISIADVSDKGVAAALYMALSRTVLRAAALDTRGPVETLKRANQILMEDSRSGMFVSLIYGILDVEQGTFHFARAGHNPPLLVRAATAEVEVLEPYGIVLGVVPDPDLEEQTIELAPGDTLILYTDGVTEAWNGQGEEFGLERLRELAREASGQGPEALIARIDEAVAAFVGGLPQADDYTLLVIQREAQA